MKDKITLLLITFVTILCLLLGRAFCDDKKILMYGEDNGVEATLLRENDKVELLIVNNSNFPLKLSSYSDEYYYAIGSEYYLLQIAELIFDGRFVTPDQIITLNPHDEVRIPIANYNKSMGDFIDKLNHERADTSMVISLNYGKIKITLKNKP